MASGNMTHLERHGNQLRVSIGVSVKAYPIIGKRRLKVALGHCDLRRAQLEKHAIIGRLKAQIAAAEREAERLAQLDPLQREAMRIHEAIALIAEAPDPALEQECLDDYLDDRASAIEARQGRRRAEDFIAFATGRATLLEAHLEAYIATIVGADDKRKGHERRSVKRLAKWCGKAKVPATVQAITPTVAARFEDAEFPPATAASTVNSCKVSLRGYWRYMIERELAAAPNPWNGRRRRAAKAYRTEEDATKREFTDAELHALLTGNAAPRLQTFMRIAALSGMRLGEIARLRVRNVQFSADGTPATFDVRLGKTAAGRRTIPMHSQLVPEIARLAHGKPAEAWLIDGLREPRKGSESTRAVPISKAFMRHRQRVLGDQAPVDFHSFRRWFITARLRALAAGSRGFLEGTLADVVGHDRKVLGMTRGTYAGTAPEAEKRACVEAVKLP